MRDERLIIKNILSERQETYWDHTQNYRIYIYVYAHIYMHILKQMSNIAKNLFCHAVKLCFKYLK